MDPNFQQPSRQPQRPGVISDFVPPRPHQTPQPAPQPPSQAQQQPAPPPPQQFQSPLQQAPKSPDTEAAPAPQRSSSFANYEPQPISPGITDRAPKPNQGLRDIMSIFGVLASALLLAFCLITFVFQSYQVDGPSMQTTLENNDHLIVWKVSKTIAKATGSFYIPNRGDVVVFDEAGTGGQDKQLIKRIIGIPGERVVVRDNEVTVYNQDFPNGFSPDKTMPYGKVIVNTPGNADVTLKENELYLMGDNRTNSLDSRHFGPVEADHIIGKLVLRVLPLNQVTKF